MKFVAVRRQTSPRCDLNSSVGYATVGLSIQSYDIVLDLFHTSFPGRNTSTVAPRSVLCQCLTSAAMT